MTLHRPERLNAFTPTMADRARRGRGGRADADDDVRVVVVTGAGRGFCAGADLGGGRRDLPRPAARRPPASAGRSTASRATGAAIASLPFAALRKPVIAAVNGPAVGIGATMTLPMDIRIAAESARFGFVFGRRRASCPRRRRSWFLPRVVGISQAMEWVATGRVFDAAGGAARAAGLAGRARRRAAAGGLRAGPRDRREHLGGRGRRARQLLWSMLGADLAVGRPPRRVAGAGRARRRAATRRGGGRVPGEAAGGGLPGPARRRRRRPAALADAARRRSAGARPDQPRLVGEDHGLHPVAQAELGEHAAEVGLHRRLADEQLGRDLGVRQAARRPAAAPRAPARSAVERRRPRRPAAGPGTNRSTSRRVSAGCSSASPAATVADGVHELLAAARP